MENEGVDGKESKRLKVGGGRGREHVNNEIERRGNRRWRVGVEGISRKWKKGFK